MDKNRSDPPSACAHTRAHPALRWVAVCTRAGHPRSLTRSARYLALHGRATALFLQQWHEHDFADYPAQGPDLTGNPPLPFPLLPHPGTMEAGTAVGSGRSACALACTSTLTLTTSSSRVARALCTSPSPPHDHRLPACSPTSMARPLTSRAASTGAVSSRPPAARPSSLRAVRPPTPAGVSPDCMCRSHPWMSIAARDASFADTRISRVPDSTPTMHETRRGHAIPTGQIGT